MRLHVEPQSVAAARRASLLRHLLCFLRNAQAEDYRGVPPRCRALTGPGARLHPTAPVTPADFVEGKKVIEIVHRGERRSAQPPIFRMTDIAVSYSIFEMFDIICSVCCCFCRTFCKSTLASCASSPASFKFSSSSVTWVSISD